VGGGGGGWIGVQGRWNRHICLGDSGKGLGGGHSVSLVLARWSAETGCWYAGTKVGVTVAVRQTPGLVVRRDGLPCHRRTLGRSSWFGSSFKIIDVLLLCSGDVCHLSPSAESRRTDGVAACLINPWQPKTDIRSTAPIRKESSIGPCVLGSTFTCGRRNKYLNPSRLHVFLAQRGSLCTWSARLYLGRREGCGCGTESNTVLSDHVALRFCGFNGQSRRIFVLGRTADFKTVQ
jgi:hypothetical protein